MKRIMTVLFMAVAMMMVTVVAHASQTRAYVKVFGLEEVAGERQEKIIAIYDDIPIDQNFFQIITRSDYQEKMVQIDIVNRQERWEQCELATVEEYEKVAMFLMEHPEIFWLEEIIQQDSQEWRASLLLKLSEKEDETYNYTKLIYKGVECSKLMKRK